MSELTDSVQTIMQDGKPAFVVIPWQEYVRHFGAQPWIPDGDAVPHEVVSRTLGGQVSQVRAWREYLGLTQKDVAQRMDVTQSALAQIEAAKRPRKKTLEKVAKALGISVAQLA